MFKRLYLHIPFCVAKCPYCSFVSFASSGSDIDEYCTLLKSELRLAREMHHPDTALDSIYFGGGTPSLLNPAHVEELIGLAAGLYSLAPDAEITLEGNPGTVDRAGLRAYRTAGVNRLSLGVQSFDDLLLSRLGRVHTAEQALRAFHEAREAGFGNVGIDLIHTLPSQTAVQWQSELQQALQLSPEHISVYGLTIEEGTPFHERYPSGSPLRPDDDLAAGMFEDADELLTRMGYEHYEIANYARPGFRSRHNSGYWRRDGCLGAGVAAHSFLRDGFGLRFSNPESMDEYRDAVSGGRLQFHRREVQRLTREDAMAEYLFLGLRMADGISSDQFEIEFGEPLLPRYEQQISLLTHSGLLVFNESRLCLTGRGMLLSNQVFSRFLP